MKTYPLTHFTRINLSNAALKGRNLKAGNRTPRRGLFMFLICLFLVVFGTLAAQDLKPEAQLQLKSLMEEKASRTPDQQKINSQIWYAYKMLGGNPITAEVSSLRTGIKKDANGFIKTNMTADVSLQLLEELASLGCRVISYSEAFNQITASIPLEAVEQLAALDGIQYIDYWMPPVKNDGRTVSVRKDVQNDLPRFPNLNSSIKRKPINGSAQKAFNTRSEAIRNSAAASMAGMMAGSVTSEGDKAHGADVARVNFGLTGAGLKIGVISDSYDNLGGAVGDVATGDLPGPGNPFGYTTPVTVLSDYVQPDTSSPTVLTDEGRAMLQIIHDLAPAAELFFATAWYNETDFAQAIIDLRSAGCDIIVDDVSYFFESVWMDGVVAQAVNSVTAAGVLYFSSAGNSGNLNDGTSGVWEGDFLDGGTLPLFPGGTLHDFGGGQLFSTLTIPGLFYLLSWSDQWANATNDYDFFVTNSDGTAIIATSTNDGASTFPVEWLVGPLNAGERFYILKNDGAEPRALRLTTNRGRLSIGTSGASYGHNAAQNTITVTASNAGVPYPDQFNASNSVETFSSDGLRKMFYHPDGSSITPGNLLFGTNGGVTLQKPDITAADGVSTSMSGFNPFFGTSAAAPHAAAIAALIKEALPSYNNTQVRDLLFSTAIDIEAPGVDQDAGHGIIMPNTALESLGFSFQNSLVTEQPGSPFNNANGILEPGEVANFNFTLVNNTTTPFTNVNAVLTCSTPGVTMVNGEFNFGSIPGPGGYVSTNQFRFATTQGMICGAELEFTLIVTYDGGFTPQQKFFAVKKIGFLVPPINGVLGSAAPTGPGFISGQGLQAGWLGWDPGDPMNMNSNCSQPVSSPNVLQTSNNYPYHSFTFQNINTTNQCVTVSRTNLPDIPLNNQTIYYTYNNNGYNPNAPGNNLLGGNWNIPGPHTFTIPAGESFTTVVTNSYPYPDTTGFEYLLEVSLATCEAVPCIATDPIVLSPESHVPGEKFTGTVGLPFSQTFSATGGSGFDSYFTDPANIPPGLTLTQNSVTATLSGIPTEPFGTPPFGAPWALVGQDALGCAPLDVNTYYIQIDPCVPVSLTTAASSNSPICSGETLNLSVAVAGQEPFTYSWSGPGGTIQNGNTATPTVVGAVSGDYSVTVTNYCGSVTSTVSVVVNTPPEISVPGPFNLNADQGQCFATFNVVDLYSFVSVSGSPTPQLSFVFLNQYPVGTSGISATATNVCGSDQAVIDIVVSDTQVPMITCPANISTPSDPDLCGALVDYAGLLTSADNCGAPALNLTAGLPSGALFPQGTTIVSYTAVDNSGNSSSCSFSVTVASDEPPVAACKNIGVELQDGSATITSADVDGGSFDPCGIQSLSLNAQDMVTLDSSNAGFNFVTLTVIDLNGNQSTCQAVVQVILQDLCPGGDDGIDSDNAGLPDDCDCSPYDAFNDKIRLKKEVNTGIDFDGIDDEIMIPNYPELIPSESNSTTFEAWIRPENTSGYRAIATSSINASVYNFGIYILNGYLLATAKNGTVLQSVNTIPENEWTHIAVVFDAAENPMDTSKIDIYLNGEPDNSLVNSFEADNFGFPIILGDISTQGWSWDGRMEEVRIWGEARTGTQIKGFMDQELKGIETNLRAYYSFNDGVPDGNNVLQPFVHDQSPYAADGTLFSFAQTGSSSNWVAINIDLAVVNTDTLDLCLTCPESANAGLDFDGIDDEITIQNAPELIPTESNSVTFEAWINPNNETGFQAIATSAINLSSYNFGIYLVDNQVTVTAKNTFLLYSNAAVPANDWTHIAVVFDADSMATGSSKIDLYINGQLDNTLVNEMEGSNLLSPILLGGINGTSWPFDGKMDEVRFWNETRTQSQIQEYMHKELFSGENGLVAYYPFNNGTPGGDNSFLATTPDASLNGRDATLSGFAKTGDFSNWVSTGLALHNPENATLSFDGVDDYISIPNNPDLIPTATNAVTYETWIYPEESTNELGFISASGTIPNRNHHIFFYNSSNKIWVTGTDVGTMISNGTVPHNAWTHIAVVFDLVETRLYINGELDNTRIQTLTATNLGLDVTFGQQSSGDPSIWSFQGKMDDARIWDHARSQEEIQELMDQELSGQEIGLAAYYTFNNGIPGGDNTTIDTVYDLSNNGNNGALNGFAQTGAFSNWAGPGLVFNNPVNAAMSFDGVDDFISIPNNLDLIPTATNAVTYETWIYPEESTNELGFISASGTIPNRNHHIFFYNSTNKIWVTGTGVGTMISNGTVPHNAWTHIAVVFDLVETRLYINGELDNTRIQTLTETNFGLDVTFGQQSSGDPVIWSFQGKMDDARIWDHARSQEEIQELMYQELSGLENGLAAYYNFNNGTPGGDNTAIDSVYDISNNGNNAAVNGFARMGEFSNWVVSPFNFGDGDRDGRPDFCDNCYAPRNRLLENMTLSGYFRATEKIMLGTGLTFPLGGSVELRAPRVEALQVVPDVPTGVSVLVAPEPCENP